MLMKTNVWFRGQQFWLEGKDSRLLKISIKALETWVIDKNGGFTMGDRSRLTATESTGIFEDCTFDEETKPLTKPNKTSPTKPKRKPDVI